MENAMWYQTMPSHWPIGNVISDYDVTKTYWNTISAYDVKLTWWKCYIRLWSHMTWWKSKIRLWLHMTWWNCNVRLWRQTDLVEMQNHTMTLCDLVELQYQTMTSYMTWWKYISNDVIWPGGNTISDYDVIWPGRNESSVYDFTWPGGIATSDYDVKLTLWKCNITLWRYMDWWNCNIRPWRQTDRVEISDYEVKLIWCWTLVEMQYQTMTSNWLSGNFISAYDSIWTDYDVIWPGGIADSEILLTWWSSYVFFVVRVAGLRNLYKSDFFFKCLDLFNTEFISQFSHIMIILHYNVHMNTLQNL
jgi:hypothetical protein